MSTDWLAETPNIAVGGRPAKRHTGRMRKVECSPCGVILYGSARALSIAGLPICGCGERMTLPNLRDRAAVEPAELEAELASYGRHAYNAAAREIGWPVWVEVHTHDRRGGAPRRCEVNGCHLFASGRYCPEHQQNRPQTGAASRRI